jgi:hypothetical protein
MQIVTVVTQYWPTLLALGAVTTAVNQAAKRLPDGPRWSRLKNIVNTVAVDYAALLAEVGGALGIGPRSKP